MPPLRTLALALPLTLAIAPAGAQDPAAAPAPVAPPATPAAAQPAPADSANLAKIVLFDTIVKLHARPRIAAKIEQVVDMLNQKFELSGEYYKDTGNRVRLQLGLVGVAGSKMLQVCDGKTLWDYQEVLGMKRYEKKEIVPILKKLEDPNLDEVTRAIFVSQLGFGGPEALLAGLQQSVAFDQFAEVQVDGVATFKLGGKWVDRTQILGPNGRDLPPTAPLPPYVPSDIQLYIDKANSWPYRVEMFGKKESLLKDERPIDPITKRPIGPKKPQTEVDPTAIILRYTLLPETSIKPDEQFTFSGPNDAPDTTDALLQSLDQVIQFRINEKKAKEAAEAADAANPNAPPPFELPPNPAPTSNPAAPATPAPR